MLQLSWTIDRHNLDTLTEHIETFSPLAVSLLDADDNPCYDETPGTRPDWPRLIVKALFPVDFNPALLTDTLRQDGMASTDLKQEVLQQQDWMAPCRQRFRAMPVGKRLCIAPSWDHGHADDRIELLLDPGLAFGSGSHPTTQLCLRWLEAQPLNGKKVLDYGCGSGILALAASLLGADQVYATDHDPQALQATRNNTALNPKASVQCLSLTDTLALETSDILLANILMKPLLNLHSVFSQLLKPAGHLVMSGILNSQWQTLQQHYQVHGFTTLAQHSMDDWSVLIMRHDG